MSSLNTILGREIMDKIPFLEKYDHAELMIGGISNLNYKLSSNDSNNPDLVMTIYFSPETWWKAEKEKKISRIFKKYQIPSFQILKIGYVRNHDQTYRYLIRNFLSTRDFSQVLRDQESLTVKDWSNILSQLGSILKSLHAIPMTGYGVIWGNGISGSDMTKINPAPNWESYINRLMLNRARQVKAIDKLYKIGDISGADIQTLFKSLYKLYDKLKFSLVEVKQPKLIHYDILLSNIILNKEQFDDSWGVSALIDNEWMSAGDPVIDLVQFENIVYFCSQKDLFKKYWSYFKQTYNGDIALSENFRKKRIIYHIMRSVFYLIAVFMLDKSRVDSKDDITATKINANYHFLTQIVKNHDLDFSLFTK